MQNITDVGHILDSGEDRILKGAARERIEPMELVERYARSYFEDMAALGVQPPDISPRASAHIPEQIEMIKALLAQGPRLRSRRLGLLRRAFLPGYGKLSGRQLEEQERGRARGRARREAQPADFALVEEGRAGAHPALAQPVGRRLPRLAHRMLGHVDQVPGRHLRHSRRRHRQHLPAQRVRNRPGRGGHRRSPLPATGCWPAR